jgi:hypothetical protein
MSRPIAFGRLEGVDHRDGATGCEEADDRGGVLAAGCGTTNPTGAPSGTPAIAHTEAMRVGVSGDLGAGIPAASNSMHDCSPVARQALRETFR